MPDPAKTSLLTKVGWLLANAAKHLNPNERRFLPSAGNFLHRGITLSRKQYAPAEQHLLPFTRIVVCVPNFNGSSRHVFCQMMMMSLKAILMSFKIEWPT